MKTLLAFAILILIAMVCFEASQPSVLLGEALAARGMLVSGVRL